MNPWVDAVLLDALQGHTATHATEVNRFLKICLGELGNVWFCLPSKKGSYSYLVLKKMIYTGTVVKIFNLTNTKLTCIYNKLVHKIGEEKSVGFSYS